MRISRDLVYANRLPDSSDALPFAGFFDFPDDFVVDDAALSVAESNARSVAATEHRTGGFRTVTAGLRLFTGG